MTTRIQRNRAEAATASALGPIMAGEMIKYFRHEGRVTGHACPPGRCDGRYGLHRYWVHFTPPGPGGGPREQLAWLYESDAIRS